MNKNTAKILIQKFHDGTLNNTENELLEKYIEEGSIELEQLTDLNLLYDDLKLEETAIPTRQMQAVFYKNLEEEKEATAPNIASNSNWWNNLFSQNFAKVNWGFGMATLIVGLLLGNLFKASETSSTEEILALTNKLQQTQETMMMALLEKESSRDRLKAVKISQEMDDVSNPIIESLLMTLNYDENVNVRMAAVEALADFSKNPIVREGLVKSIQNQDSPMVQLKLAELMVYLQDKNSVNEFQKLMDKKETPNEIRTQLKEKIKVLL